jgi:hypothetical protein
MKNFMYWGSSVRAVSRQAAALVRRAKRRFCLQSQQELDTHEMQTDPSSMLNVEISFGSSLDTA